MKSDAATTTTTTTTTPAHYHFLIPMHRQHLIPRE
jgi:hypothetical protein